MRIPLTDTTNPAGSGTQPPRKSNWDAVHLSIFLGLGAALLIWALGSAAILVGFFLEFLLPIPVCLRARSKVALLSLIPNALVNFWFVLVQSPRSPYWAGWRNEWAPGLAVLCFGAAASLIVSGLFIWRGRATEIT